MTSVYHENLECDNQSIRILTLLPGPWSTRIETKLRQVSLNDSPIYEAVSYTWGSSDDTASVWVEGIEILVPRNLETCLRYLRKLDVDLHIWADSICINQCNLREKEFQIAMMGEIFRCCTSVFIWLGVPSQQGPLAANGETMDLEADPFTIVHHFADDRHLHELSCFQGEPSDDHFKFHDDLSFKKIWESFKDAFQKPWWSRLWCVQECLLPSKAMVVLGHWRITWETLKRGQMMHTRHVRSCCLKVSGLMPHEYAFAADMTILHTQQNSTATTSPLDQSLNLDHLLRSFSYKACKDPRDKVYGILGLVDRSNYPQLAIDYSLDIAAVYISTMSAILLNSGGDLSCLTGYGFASVEYNLPSWVRNFGAISNFDSVSQRLKRFQAYSLYNASGFTRYQPVILDKTLLRLHGSRVDKISHIGRAIESGRCQHVYEVFQDWSVLSGVSILTEMSCEYFYNSRGNDFWRTAVGDRLFETDHLLRRANEADLEGLRRWLPMMLSAMKKGADPPLEAWLRTIISFIYERSMFLTEKSHLGLCYPACQPGDEIWILHGGRVPFILRPIDQSYEQGLQHGDQYKFMGDSYLHGFMDGEVFKNHLFETREVILC